MPTPSRKKVPNIAICEDPFNRESSDRMIEQINQAGGNAVLISSYCLLEKDIRQQGIDTFMRQFDGLVLLGNDRFSVDPERYIHRLPENQQKIHPNTRSETGSEAPLITKSRANVERQMLHEALRKRMPVVGICGGMQRINVECGEEQGNRKGRGTLHQFLPDVVGDNRHSQEHCGHGAEEATQEVQIVSGSKLSGLLHSMEYELPDIRAIIPDSSPATSVMVSTRHQQAVDRLADGLKVAAFTREKHATDNHDVTIIKAIEADPKGKYKNQFILGTQFHPELVAGHILGDKIAERTVKEAQKYAKQRHTSAARKSESHRDSVATSRNGQEHRR